MELTTYTLKPCKKCGGQAEIRHCKSLDLQYLIKFRFHPNQYFCSCSKCGAKIPSRHKITLAIEDWNEHNKGVRIRVY